MWLQHGDKVIDPERPVYAPFALREDLFQKVAQASFIFLQLEPSPGEGLEEGDV
jgi:hypothetical protein